MNRSFSSKMLVPDIKAAIEAFACEDFELMNIFGNRIMSDALFTDDVRTALLGFFIKDAAFRFLNLKARLQSAELSEVKRTGEQYLNTLKDFPENVSDGHLWQCFHDFHDNIRSHSISDIEKRVYKQDPEITSSVFTWLTKCLNDKKEIVFDANNRFFKGILNEMDRVYRAYGGHLNDTYALSLLIALDRYFDYFRVQHRTAQGEIDREKVTAIIFPYIKRITRLASSKEIKPEKVTSVLWELIKGWREYFVYYMELEHQAPEKSVELPEESKKKLAKVIGKALEREIKP